MSRTASKTCVALGIALGVLFALQASAREITCQEAQSWVQAHHDGLPGNLDDFAALPRALRPAVLGALSPDVKSQLWAEHVEHYAAAHLEMTAAQHAVLDGLLKVVRSPQTFGRTPLGPRALATMGRLEQQVRDAFGADQAEVILTRLGEVGVSPTLQRLAAFSSFVEADPAPDPVGTTSDVPACTCSTSSDWCASGQYCKAVKCAQSGGCGTLGLYTCTGICYVKITNPGTDLTSGQ
jgi:hypothetical protein